MHKNKLYFINKTPGAVEEWDMDLLIETWKAPEIPASFKTSVTLNPKELVNL